MNRAHSAESALSGPPFWRVFGFSTAMQLITAGVLSIVDSVGDVPFKVWMVFGVGYTILGQVLFARSSA